MDSQGSVGILYHEFQTGELCGLHSLNTALQGPYFTEDDLKKIAAELDAAEQEVMLCAGSTEVVDYLTGGSYNISKNGNFSIQVLERALQQYNLQFISMSSQAAGASQSNHELETAFICNFQNHWFCIRNVDGEWYNFNSQFAAPAHFSRFSLSAYLNNMRGSGWSIYAIRGSFPTDCPNDYNDFGQWLTPDEARIITLRRYHMQLIEQSNKATEMASRMYRMAAIAYSFRGVEIPGTKTEAPTQQPYPKDMTTEDEENDSELKAAITLSLTTTEDEENDGELKAAIALSLMTCEATVTSPDSYPRKKLKEESNEDNTMEEHGGSNSEPMENN